MSPPLTAGEAVLVGRGGAAEASAVLRVWSPAPADVATAADAVADAVPAEGAREETFAPPS